MINLERVTVFKSIIFKILFFQFFKTTFREFNSGVDVTNKKRPIKIRELNSSTELDSERGFPSHTIKV